MFSLRRLAAALGTNAEGQVLEAMALGARLQESRQQLIVSARAKKAEVQQEKQAKKAEVQQEKQAKRAKKAKNAKKPQAPLDVNTIPERCRGP